MREGGFRTWMSTLETCEGVSWVTKFVFLLNKVINKNHTVRGEIRTWMSILEHAKVLVELQNLYFYTIK